MSDGGVVQREPGKLELSLDEDEDENVAVMFVGWVNHGMNDMAKESIIYIYLPRTGNTGSYSLIMSNKNRAPGEALGSGHRRIKRLPDRKVLSIKGELKVSSIEKLLSTTTGRRAGARWTCN